MKKLILALTILVAVSVVQAAPTYRLTTDDLLSFDILDSEVSLADVQLVKTLTPEIGNVGFTLADISNAGYLDSSSNPILNADGEAKYGQMIANKDWVLIGATIDLGTSNYDAISLTVNNINDDRWNYALSVDETSFDMPSDVATLSPYADTPYSATLEQGGSYTGEVNVGIYIQNNHTSGDSDVMNTSVTVPAPGAFLLGGIGLSIVGYIKRRRMLN